MSRIMKCYLGCGRRMDVDEATYIEFAGGKFTCGLCTKGDAIQRQEGHELKELHRKLRGSLLQLESLMISLDIPFKAS